MEPEPLMTLEEPERASAEERVLTLYREHGRRLYGYALGLLGNRADAEDVVQDAFLRLGQHLAKKGDEANLRGWLYRVATNLCRDRQRGRMRHAGAAPDSAGPTPTALSAIAIERVLTRLKPRDRELVLLRGEGLSYAEIAVSTATNPSSIGTLLARALRQFAEEYAREFGKE